MRGWGGEEDDAETLAPLSKINPNHRPPGPGGGQFAPGPQGGAKELPAGGATEADGRFHASKGITPRFAAALNRIATQPNSTARVSIGGYDVSLSRGPGATVGAQARILGFGFAATASMAASVDHAEVDFRDVSIKGPPFLIGAAPNSMRLFQTPSGERRIELGSPLHINLAGASRPAGQYVVEGN